MSQPSFTGRDRARVTPRSVRTAERIARFFISAGGIGTIVAVTLIFAFLLVVVAPLFGNAGIADERTFAGPAADKDTLATGMDEFRLMGWTLQVDGRLRTFRLHDGAVLAEEQLFAGARPTAWTIAPNDTNFALGYDDGSIRTGKIEFATRYLDRADVPAELRDLEPGDVARLGGGLVQVTPIGQFRQQELQVTLGEPLRTGTDGLVSLDYSVRPDESRAYVALTTEGRLAQYVERTKTNLITGAKTIKLSQTEIPYDADPSAGRPNRVLMNGTGTHILLIWDRGDCIRFDVSDVANPAEAERVKLVADGQTITQARFQVGKTTLLVGDSGGMIRAWFVTRPEENPGTGDGATLVAAHELPGPDAAVTALSLSTRSRVIAAGYGDGSTKLFYVTTATELLSTPGGGGAVYGLKLSPKQDMVLALGETIARTWEIDVGYPEATLSSLLMPVWYEGSATPKHAWQSTGATDDFEPKLGLVPLIFGTLKATLYAILIAAPIALLAAVYTSEFMRPAHRARVKSVIEMMASLPSVVLGFMGAIILAPFIQHVVPHTLVALLIVPFMFLLGARLWQLLPTRRSVLWGGAPRLAAMLLSLGIGVLLANAIGPWFERLAFRWTDDTGKTHATITAWLADGEMRGSATGAFMLLLLPLVSLGLVVLNTFVVSPMIRAASTEWSRFQCGVADILRFAATTGVAILFAWLLGVALDAVGADPRAGFLGPYSQLNALIVGFVMGFAIVPIIYTLAEDALSSVPSQLREGSLGAGATPWQTAWRIVIPAAMSGLFGALMVGLGRAVGETMIVLMAAGNTPLMEWNPFNGFRTLSANLAVELPEAPVGTTHYRTLFLAAFTLFLMTFGINILAEWVRRIFRRRFADL